MSAIYNFEMYWISGLAETIQQEIADIEIIKMMRSKKQIGIVQSRMQAVKEATGDVVAFLDSHCK